MNTSHTRREFLAEVSRGMLVATVGFEVASELGLASSPGDEVPLSFGLLEPLVCLMQETPVNRLLPKLVEQLRAGEYLRRLVAAAALANARTFGGEDNVGFHTMMALSPALHMSQELPKELQPLPVFKVLYRNTNRIQERGGRKDEVLHSVEPARPSEIPLNSEQLRDAVRRQDVNLAEERFARLSLQSPADAFDHLLFTVQDNTEVHRVVLPYRVWDLLELIGREQAQVLL